MESGVSLEGGGFQDNAANAGSIVLAATLCVCFLLVLFCASGQVCRSEQRESWAASRNVFSCARSECIVAIPTLLEMSGAARAWGDKVSAASLFPASGSAMSPLSDFTRARITGISANYAAFNTSIARIQLGSGRRVLVGATRVSSHMNCPHRSSIATSTSDASVASPNQVLLTIDNVPFRLEISQDMHRTLWPTPALQAFSGIEDARPFQLQPGLLGLAATCVRVRPQMCIVVVEMPSSPPAELFSALSIEHSNAPAEVLTVRPRSITLLGPTDGTPQKNWMPFVDDANLVFIKHVSPQTNVSVPLRAVEQAVGVIELESQVLLSADKRALQVTLPSGNEKSSWRGSTPLIKWPLRGTRLAVVHRVVRWNPLRYEHAFVEFQSSAPYALVSMSRRFEIDVQFTKFSFVAGLLLPDADRGDGSDYALLTFGADDCYGQSLAVELAAIEAMFQQGPESPPLHIPVSLEAIQEKREQARLDFSFVSLH